MTRFSRMRQDEGSMMLFFLVLIVISAMSAVTLATVMSSQTSSRHSTNYQEDLPQADVGVQRALFALNNGAVATLPSQANPATLTGASSSGSWYVTHPSTLEYDVVSTSRQGSVTRTVTAKVLDQPRFPLAAFADASITFRGGNSADSYDHRNQSSDTGDGDTGSNGSITFNGNATADGVVLYDWLTNSSGTRCSGTPCAGLVTVDPKLDISSASATAFISSGIAACGGTLTDWVASANGGVLTPGTHCYKSMSFDVATTNQGTDANPTIIYVTGNVSVDNHLNVNIPASPTLPNAQALQIYTLGDSIAIGNHSAIGAAIWAPHADCGGNPSNAQADVWGALVCSSISNQGGWGFHYDDALGSFGMGQWYVKHYAES